MSFLPYNDWTPDEQTWDDVEARGDEGIHILRKIMSEDDAQRTHNSAQRILRTLRDAGLSPREAGEELKSYFQ